MVKAKTEKKVEAKVEKKVAAPKKAAPAKAAPAKAAKPAEKKVEKKVAWKAAPIKTKADLIKQLKESVNTELSTKTTNELIDNLFAILSTSIKKHERFTVPGFGTFAVKKRKARTGRNPQTGDKIKIKAHKTVGFKPTPKLKENLG